MRTIKHPGVRELQVRRSRFICALGRITTETEALEFIDARRRAHRDAAHTCTAYVLGEHAGITRCGDDGEPAGTAGPPMLEALTGRGLSGVVAVVTRYFGGTRLGTGGLIRAYGRVVADTVAAVGVVELCPVITVTVTVGHDRAGRLRRDLHASPYRPAAARYGARAEIDVLVPRPDLEAFETWAAAATGGHATLRRGPAGVIEADV